MKVLGTRVSLRGWGLFMVSISCAIVFARPIKGQEVGDPAKLRIQEMDRRELQLNTLGGDNRHANDPKRSRSLMDQVGEDFQRILTLHNEIVRAVGANQSLSVKFVSEAMGEIRKRSARLQSSLQLQKPETGPDSQEAAPDLKVMSVEDEMIRLCRQIENFVRNPIIEKPGTVDAQQLQRARKDLQSVVELSAAIKKQVDKQRP
jgi:hypothetical protein